MPASLPKLCSTKEEDSPPDCEQRWGLPVPLCIWLSAPPQVDGESSHSAELVPLCPCCHGAAAQPGQSGRRWISEPLLLKPKQNAWPMGRVAEWSHHGNLSPKFQPGFCCLQGYAEFSAVLFFFFFSLQRVSCGPGRTFRSHSRGV